MEKNRYEFRLSAAEIDRVSEKAADYFKEVKLNKIDCIKNRISLEECLLPMLASHEGAQGLLILGKSWDVPFVEVRIHGAEFIGTESADDLSQYSNRILKNMEISPVISYRNGWNTINLKLKSKEKNPIIPILGAIVLAVVVSGIVRLMPGPVLNVIQALADPLFDCMLGIICAIAGPMVFLSVVCGICNIGDISQLGNIGKKMLTRFVVGTFILSLIACIIGFLTQHLCYTNAGGGFSQFSEIYAMILQMVPSNVVTPFVDNNTMQIIVIAIAMGIVMLLLGQKASYVTDFAGHLNNIVQYIMMVVAKCMPVFIFTSLISLLISDSVTDVINCWKIFLLILICMVVCMLVSIVYASIRLKVPFSLLMKKMLPTYLIALSTASSSAAFSTSLDCLEKRMGISPNLTRFGLPLGTVLFKWPNVFTFALVVIYFAQQQELAVSMGWFATLIITCAVLTLSLPPIPGGAISCYSIMFTQMGIDDSALAVTIILDLLLDYFCTSCTVSMLQIELMLQADRQKMLDRNVLRSSS